MECTALFAQIESLYAQYLDIWEEVCNIESPTSHKEGVDAVGRYFAAMAKEHGWQVEYAPQELVGDAICITMNPRAPGQGVTFSGHMDTVHPVGLFGTPAVRRDETYIYGPGVADCKGGIVASFLAMDALERCGFRDRPVQLILQSDEENSSMTSDLKTVEFMCRKAKDSVAFLNAEGIEGDTAVIVRKGILQYAFHITGKAAHAASCHKGASAIAEAAHKILQLEKLKDPEGLTCNCGVITGGTVPNAVAEKCSFTVDIRFANEEKFRQATELVEQVAAHTNIPGCGCVVERTCVRPAMPLEERNAALLETMNGIFARNGLPRLEQKTGLGGSDAAYTTRAGIPCVDSIGVAGFDIHSARERARLRSLAECAKRLAAVAYCIT